MVLLATAVAVVVICLLDFYALLPALSIYTFRLVRTGEGPEMDTTDHGRLR